VRVGIQAPSDVSILRKEIKETIDENFSASKSNKEKLRNLNMYLKEKDKA
jgi:sRNA-binding carbon storage regulator CsrA